MNLKDKAAIWLFLLFRGHKRALAIINMEWQPTPQQRPSNRWTEEACHRNFQQNKPMTHHRHPKVAKTKLRTRKSNTAHCSQDREERVGAGEMAQEPRRQSCKLAHCRGKAFVARVTLPAPSFSHTLYLLRQVQRVCCECTVNVH